ncbi:DUF2439 domain-containing protein [Pyrenophora tritici-repentis]|nr:DUF2439 domain-containing protein [Pyrenophora tritici-repentis]
MTAPLRNTQHASAIAAIAASQNTAPVTEFRCLFTQDIKRKQKRWQDGYLKFHTFNNRVMVYDQARNFLGDTYYKDRNELQEGDELNLNNGALVEVAEAMGITHTDLKPLLEKKNKEAPPRPSAPSQSKPFQRPSSVVPTNAPRNGSQLRHKSLNTLLGTPKGPIGKAQPMKSPQKTAQAPPAWRASSPVQEESPAARSRVQVPARKPNKFIPPTATVITIESESDPHPTCLSDVSMPSTPPKVAKARAERRQLATPAPEPLSRQPPAKTPRIPKGKVPVPSVRALETPKQRAPPSSPPVSVSNRLSNVDFAIQLSKEPPKEPTPSKEPELPVAPPAGRKPKSLRLTAGVKRGRLLCQTVAQQAPTVAASKDLSRAASRPASKEPSPALNHENDTTLRSRVSASKRKSTNAGDVAPKRVRVSKSPSVPSSSLCEDPEVIHGRMDQQLLVPSSPVQVQIASSPPVEVSKPKPVPAKKAASKKATVSKSPEAIAPEPKSPSPKPVPRKVQTRKKVVEKSVPAPPAAPMPDPPRRAARDASPVHTEPPGAQSRAHPAKRSKKQPATTDSNTDAATPLHPLQTNEKGPKMSTTELASVLQQSNSLAKALADPIEDEPNIIATGKSSNRNFRRVRSENDAPIPSISEEWEKRNLPKPRTDTLDDTPQSTKVAGAAEPVPEVPKKKGGLSALIKKTDPRRMFKRTQSLHVDTSSDIPETMKEIECPSPVVDVDIGPWSTEAGDLFDWRPPGREKK